MNDVSNNIENLSTEVTEEELVDSVADEFGTLYSRDGKKLLKFINDDVTHYTIKEGTEIVTFCAFKSCKNLIELIIPNSVTIIGPYAFSAPNTVIKRIVIGNNVKKIGDGAFHGPISREIEEIVIPNSVIEIGGWAFCGLNMRRLIIGENVTLIDDCAFDICELLEELTFNCRKCSIGQTAFNRLKRLRKIVIGENVSMIPYGLFSDEYRLRCVYSLGFEPPMCQSHLFDNIASRPCTLYVPNGSKEAYSNADGWRSFKNIIEIDKY